MKRIALLATVALALSACGTTTAPTQSAEEGTLTLNFYKAGAQGLKQLDLFSDKTTNIRVRVSNPSTGFNVVRDVTTDAAQNINVSVPAIDGYMVEAISYVNSGREMLKMGSKSGVSVVANSTQQVDLVLKRPDVKMILPDSVKAGEAFTASISGVPERMFTGLFFGVSNTPRTSNIANGGAYFPNASSNSTTFNGTYNLTAPETNGSSQMFAYMEFLFYMQGPWKIDSDQDSLLRLWLPSVGMGEKTPTTTLIEPAGGISIGITY